MEWNILIPCLFILLLWHFDLWNTRGLTIASNPPLRDEQIWNQRRPRGPKTGTASSESATGWGGEEDGLGDNSLEIKKWILCTKIIFYFLFYFFVSFWFPVICLWILVCLFFVQDLVPTNYPEWENNLETKFKGLLTDFFVVFLVTLVNPSSPFLCLNRKIRMDEMENFG